MLLNRSRLYWGNMTRLTVSLAGGLMLAFGQNVGIRRPEIGEQQANLVGIRDTLPQQVTGGFASAANGVGNNLAGAAALSQPNPPLVLAPRHERPEFVHLQHVIGLGRSEGRRQQVRVVANSGRCATFF